MSEVHQRLIESCAFRPLRDAQDLEAHRAWAAWLASIGHRPEWLQQQIAEAARRLGAS